MLNYSNLIESSNSYNLISQDVASSRLSHAYLLLNSDKNYLIKFVETVCNLLLNKDNPELAEKNKLRIEKRIHPDIKFFGEEKTIDASTVGEIVETAQIAPFEANIKVFVLIDTQNMNETSQNKILKTIEEPPKNTYFFLLCSAKERMLPTILSRVKQIELNSPTTAQIAQMLQEGGVKKEVADIYASCADSNAEFAEKLATDENFLNLFNKVVSAFVNIKGSRDVIEYASYFSNKNIDKKEVVQIALMLSRDIQMVLLGASELVCLKSELPKLKLISASLTIGGANEIAATCIAAKKELFFNVNQTAVSDGLLFKIAEVKVKCKKFMG